MSIEVGETIALRVTRANNGWIISASGDDYRSGNSPRDIFLAEDLESAIKMAMAAITTETLRKADEPKPPIPVGTASKLTTAKLVPGSISTTTIAGTTYAIGQNGIGTAVSTA